MTKHKDLKADFIMANPLQSKSGEQLMPITIPDGMAKEGLQAMQTTVDFQNSLNFLRMVLQVFACNELLSDDGTSLKLGDKFIENNLC